MLKCRFAWPIYVTLIWAPAALAVPQGPEIIARINRCLDGKRIQSSEIVLVQDGKDLSILPFDHRLNNSLKLTFSSAANLNSKSDGDLSTLGKLKAFNLHFSYFDDRGQPYASGSIFRVEDSAEPVVVAEGEFTGVGGFGGCTEGVPPICRYPLPLDYDQSQIDRETHGTRERLLLKRKLTLTLRETLASLFSEEFGFIDSIALKLSRDQASALAQNRSGWLTAIQSRNIKVRAIAKVCPGDKQ